MGSKRIVGDLVWPCGEQRYTAKPLSSHVFSFSVSWFPDMLLKYAKKSHPFPSKIWKKVLTCWMLTFQKSYKFHHFHHLNLSCDWEFNCSSRNIWTISGGCRKWGFPQIIPKLDHFRKFSLETSIETDGFGDPFKEPPHIPHIDTYPDGNPQPTLRHGYVCHVGAYDPAVARLQHDPVQVRWPLFGGLQPWSWL